MSTNNIKELNPSWKKIGERINTLIAEHDTSQKALADHLEIKPNIVSDWCHGKRTPNTEQIVRIADYFNVSADYLLCRTKNKPADFKLQAICEYTGLDEKAANILHTFATEEFGYRYVERPNSSCEIEGIEIDKEFNENAMSFINGLITNDKFHRIINNAVNLKETISDISNTIPDSDNEEQAQMILTKQNMKILHNAKRFVVTDEGYLGLMKEQIKAVFGNILDDIIDTDK